jgi:hypothetical protein
MNLKRLHKLADELRKTKYIIKEAGDYHRIFYKKVIIASVPEENLAEHIAREYDALNERMAKQIDSLIEQMEASAKQKLLNLDFGGEYAVPEERIG